MAKVELLLLVMAALRLEAVTWRQHYTSKKEYAHIPIQTSITINSARRKCIQIGGKLPEPRTKSENDAQKYWAYTNGIKWYWIGINDEDREGHWVFESDNASVGFFNWYGRNPEDGAGGEDCVVVRADNGYNDVNCGYDLSDKKDRAIVCEKIPERKLYRAHPNKCKYWYEMICPKGTKWSQSKTICVDLAGGETCPAEG